MQKTWTWSTTGYSFTARSPEEVIELCTHASLSGVEAAMELFSDQSDTELENTAAQFKKAGLQIDSFHLPFTAVDDIVCFYETTRRQAVERLTRALERAAILGARTAIQHPSTNRFDVDLEGLDNYLRQMDRSLQILLPCAEKLGITIAVENMLPGEAGPRLGSRPEHFALFTEKFAHPHLGYCLDTGHALVAGGPDGAHAFFEAMAPHLVAFHLADNAGDRDSHLAPGHGLVDWNRLFKGMAEIGFAHPACIETAPFAHGPNNTQSPDAWKQMVTETEALAEQALAS